MYFQILLLFILSIIIVVIINNKLIKKLASSFLSILITSEVISIFIGGSLIDYKFYKHANIDDFVIGLEQYWIYFLFSIILIPILSYSIYISNILSNRNIVGNKILIVVSFIILSFMSLNGGVMNNLYEIYKIETTDDVDFDTALRNLSINPSEYITPDKLRAKGGKNIIIISMESIERGFLSEEYKEVTPNLRKLANKWTYLDMKQVKGASWTSGSLYTFLSGIPSLVKTGTKNNHHGSNDEFQNTTNIEITGLGNVFNASGYLTKMLIGEADFSGTREMVEAFNVNIEDREDFKTEYAHARFGLFDYDLFLEAKNNIDNYIIKKEKFALILSTVSTHPPYGVYDNRLEDRFKNKSFSKHEYTIATLDFLIGDLINYLKQKNIYNNTSIYIFPDHLLHGDNLGELEKLDKERSLFLLSNVKKDKLGIDVDENIYQIDLPRLIVDGAEIETNANFLTDFITISEKDKFINDNVTKIVALNDAALHKSAFTGDIDISINGGQLSIKSSDDSIVFNGLNSKKGYTKQLFFSDYLVLLKNEDIPFNVSLDYLERENQYLPLVVNVKNDKIFAYIGDKRMNGYTTVGNNKVTIPSTIIKSIITSKINYQTIHTDEISNCEKLKTDNLISVRSSGGSSRKVRNSYIKTIGTNFTLKRGLNVVYNDSGIDKIKYFDTYVKKINATNFIAFVRKMKNDNKPFLVVANDEATKQLKTVREELKCIGFYDLASLEFRASYIAYFNSRELNEIVGASNNSIKSIFPWNVLPINKPQIISNSELNDLMKDENRFIAHGAGTIDKIKGTNSLEALELNYKKGFRLFELDIIKTSDNYFVAAHDWKQWAARVKYKGSLPVTKEEFLAHKLHGKYTPIDMDRINRWFKKYPDAILVTDKVNTPKEFASKFIDKERLIMELFSMNALKEGLSIGIRSAMPTEGVFFNIKGDRIKILKDLGVKHIAMSRNKIADNKNFLLKVKDAGIKIYVYHVNFGKKYDEEYVLNKELKYVYGMYADKWDFNKKMNCN